MPTSLTFGCGYAPGGWDELVKALTAQGFTLGRAVHRRAGPAGTARARWTGSTGGWSGRSGTPPATSSASAPAGSIDDDRIEAKYINTSDTPLYHKSQVLYGLDLAKRDIAKQRRAVVVEGYTDVMAMHVAGVTTAVASCGTAFGDEHIGVLRRYLLDSEVIRGEVIYTFDGDAAGQKAALKAFDSDQKFAANTFIAVAPDNLDPCELRQQQGDAALRDLVDVKTAAVRVRDLAPRSPATTWPPPRAGWRPRKAVVPLVGPDPGARPARQYVNELAPQLGDGSRRAVAAGPPHASNERAATEPPAGVGARASRPAPSRPDPADRATEAEREALKLALQHPDLVAGEYERLEDSAFTDASYVRLHAGILAAGDLSTAAPGRPGSARSATSCRRTCIRCSVSWRWSRSDTGWTSPAPTPARCSPPCCCAARRRGYGSCSPSCAGPRPTATPRSAPS